MFRAMARSKIITDIKRRKTHRLFPALGAVFSVATGMLVSRMVGVICAVATIYLTLVIFVPWDTITKRINKTAKRLHINLVQYAIPILLCGAFVIPLWGYVVNIFPSNNNNKQTQSLSELPPFYNTQQVVTISFGKGEFQRTVEQLEQEPQSPVNFYGFIPFTVYIKDRKILVDCSLYGGLGEPPATISELGFTVKPNGWDANADENAFEVVNDKQQAVLQLIYLSQYHVVINGYFYSANGVYVANYGGDTYFTYEPTTGITYSIKRIFKYPSSEYQGVRG